MAYTDIDKPSDYFNTVTYTGTGTTNSITGVGFQPDFVWTKSRSAVYDHFLTDVILRTTNKYLRCNTTNAEQTGVFSSLDSDGFTISGNSGNNTSGATEVSWNWLAGGTAVSNTDGSITSSVSANTTAGFSIVSWTGNGTNGASIGHGLGTTPSSWIIKQRTGTQVWLVYHTGLSATDNYLQLNGTNAEATNAPNIWSADSTKLTFPTSYLGTNGSGSDYIGYFFAEKKGFSKFGKYTGNGSADGTFVYTGFKPAMVIVKSSSSAYSWYMFDNKRSGYNVDNDSLSPDLSSTEYDGSTYNFIDLLSNGFKMRETYAGRNGSGSTYIYLAFAENPFTTSTGIPTTAR